MTIIAGPGVTASSQVTITDARDADCARWDETVGESVNGTIFHLRAFLAYHGDKFRGSERFLVARSPGGVVAQIALTVNENPDGTREVLSPYGASYGGFVLHHSLTHREAKGLVGAFVDWLRSTGISRCRLTFPIACCNKVSVDTLYFALLEHGFRLSTREVTSVFCLEPRRPAYEQVYDRARRTARRAANAGVTIDFHGDLDDFWRVLELTYAKHGVPPTHTHAEYKRLTELLPDRVFAHVAYHDDEPVAALGCFVITPTVNSSFYICQDPAKDDLQGLSLLILETLSRMEQEGYRYFNFGTMTVNMEPRENIFMFKENFSRVGVFRDTYEWRAPRVDTTPMKTVEEWKTYWNAKRGPNPVALNDYCIDGIPLERGRYEEAVVKPNVERLDIGPACDVLEIGCGTGLHLREMEGRVRRLVGTDLSVTMLSHYGGSAARCVSEAGRQPFRSGSFDRILMAGVTMYFPGFDYFKVTVEECLDLLRADGILLVGDMQFGTGVSRSGYLVYSKSKVVEFLDSLGYPYSLLAQSRLKRAINNRHDILIYKETRRAPGGNR